MALPSVSLQTLANTAPAGALGALISTLVALVAILLAWALLAHLDIVAVAPGKLVPASQVKTVQVAEAGIVREILVHDGDQVTAGQTLVRMDTTLASAEAGQVTQELALKRITVRAIDAALAGLDFAARPGEPAALFALVSAQFLARRQALEDAVHQELQAAARARGERLAAEQVRDKLRTTLPVLQQSADSFGRLQQEGFVGELIANDKRREAIEREQDLKAQEATLQALAAAIAQAEQRTVQLRSTFRSQLLGERVEAQAIAERLQQEQAKLGFRSAQLDIRAPHDGVVQNLVTHTPGAVVQPGTVLLHVVPRGDALRAEAALANEDIGFVETGQHAKLKLAAYPFQKYGLLEGRVTQISADAQEPATAAKATGSAQTVAPLTYKAVIELDAQNLVLPNGAQLQLAPGMAVTAEIHQGRRTVLEYLLSPVQRVTAEAGRER
jgi:HlyD family secretion protein